MGWGAKRWIGPRNPVRKESACACRGEQRGERQGWGWERRGRERRGPGGGRRRCLWGGPKNNPRSGERGSVASAAPGCPTCPGGSGKCPSCPRGNGAAAGSQRRLLWQLEGCGGGTGTCWQEAPSSALGSPQPRSVPVAKAEHPRGVTLGQRCTPAGETASLQQPPGRVWPAAGSPSAPGGHSRPQDSGMQEWEGWPSTSRSFPQHLSSPFPPPAAPRQRRVSIEDL